MVNNRVPLTLSLIAIAKTDPKIGPIQGLHPKANAIPINKGKNEIFCNLSKFSFLSKSKKGTFKIPKKIVREI